MRSALALLSLFGALAGCTLVDQRTFRREGRAPAAADIARAEKPDYPLLTLRFDTGDVDIQPLVNSAAEAVLSRKADADYDVVAPIPTGAAPDVQARFERNGQEDTARVVTALGYAGVSIDRVHVAFRGDAGAPPREVRVYVR